MENTIIENVYDIHRDRLESYNDNCCWQYDIRLKNYEFDVVESNIKKEELLNLKVGDFEFKNVTDKAERSNLVSFIKKHEWLGTITQYTTHWFGAYYKDILAGVILMGMPNSFSKMLGEDTREIERLISRGACISWSPKNLGSAMLMWCVKWMVKNTQYRLFTAYSDPSAKELGTIYQACNFYYMGQKSGTTTRYVNPYTGKIVSDRFFRVRSAYKKYAKEMNIVWQKDWNNDQRMLWENIPEDIEKKLRDFSKYKQSISEKVEYKPKHKYAMVLGCSKKEQKELIKIFLELNKVYEYPKNRGE